MGIEPTLFAWEARVLPLNDTRIGLDCRCEWLPWFVTSAVVDCVKCDWVGWLCRNFHARHLSLAQPMWLAT
jgi:hypothetical protein